MKKLMMLLTAVFAATMPLWADTETVGGYTWTYRLNGETAEIYRGGACAISPKPNGAVSIPSALGGKPVTSIGYRAFYGCSGLTSVTISDSVTSIGDMAFYGCSGLTSVTISDSVTSIGDMAFYGCSGLTSVTIPNGVASIKASTFSGCSGLASVTIPDSVTNIGYRAFYECSGLTSVTIGNGVTSIWDAAFYGCDRLMSVRIPNGVTSIGEGAFAYCGDLTSVTIPASVTKIGYDAFYECSGLTSVHIFDIAAWCRISFCPRIMVSPQSNPLYYAHNLYLNGTLVTNLIIPEGVKNIERLFCGCSSLTSVTIPDSVTGIGADAFYGCSGLTSVTIPNGVKYIGRRAFEKCNGLTSVMIPASVTSIDSTAFYNCGGLMRIDVVDGNVKYTSVNGLLLSQDGKKLVKGVNGDVIIPDSVSVIQGSSFYNCSGLTSVTIPASVTNIGANAFYGCSGLRSVTIPENVELVGTCAFASNVTLSTSYFLGLPPSSEESNGLVPVMAASSGSQTGGAGSYYDRVNQPQSPTQSPSKSYLVFDGCSASAVGYYPSKYAAEWRAALDSDGKWQGLKMREYAGGGSPGGSGSGTSGGEGNGESGSGGVGGETDGGGDGVVVSPTTEEVQQEWYASVSRKREATSVSIGKESWNASDKDKPLPYRFPCGAVLHSTLGGKRLDLSNVVVSGRIKADGNLAILLAGNNFVSDGIVIYGYFDSYYPLLVFGPGSLTVRGGYPGAIRSSELSICAGASVTVYDTEGWTPLCGSRLSVYMSSLAVYAPEASGASFNAINIYGSAVSVYARNSGLGAYESTIVIDGSVVNVFEHPSSNYVDYHKMISCTHSYLSWAKVGGSALQAGQAYFDNSLVKLYSKTAKGLTVDDVTFGEGDYYIASGSTDSAVAATTMTIAGGNVQVCASEENASGVNATNFKIDSGRIEIVDKIDISEFLEFDGAAAAIFTGAVAGGAIDSSALMANFYSQVISDAISNGKIGNLEGNAYAGIKCNTYTQNCGTVWCDLPTYGVLTDTSPIINGGSYKGDFFKLSYISFNQSGPNVIVPTYVETDGTKLSLKCVSHSISGASKYDKITQSWNGILPSYYGTGSLYADEYGKLYFWLPETWSGDNGGGSSDGGAGGDGSGGSSDEGGSGDGTLPDLKPYTPSGWSAPLVVSASSTSTMGATVFSSDASLYLNWAFISVDADVTETFYTRLYVDGSLVQTWNIVDGLNKDYYISVKGFSLGNLNVGTHTLRIVTDSTGIVTESNESNNSYEITITVSDGSGSNGGTAADLAFYVPEHKGWTAPLIVSSDPCGTSPQSVFEQGETIFLNYAFKNIGNGLAVSNFVNRFTLNNGQYWENSWYDSVLPENGWGWLGNNFTPGFLKDLPPGDYTLTCTLNVDGSLQGDDTDNNTTSVSFRVKGPDLTVSSLSVSRDVITLSETATLRWGVTNSGDGSASASKTRVRLYNSSGSSTELAYVDCVPLAASGSAEYTLTLSGKKIGIGEYYILVDADEKDAVAESDETNNGKRVSFKVESDHSTYSTANVDWQFKKLNSSDPDSFYLSSDSGLKKKVTTFNVGQPIYMRRAFWNAKKKAVYGEVTSSYWLNGVRVVSSLDESYINVNTILYNTVTCLDFLQNLPAGNYTLTAVLDSENAWQETNEKNNVKTISFTVVGTPQIFCATSYTCALNEPVSWPVTIDGKATVTGLPSGLKYSGGVIAGKATKVGTYTVNISTKNEAGTATKSITIKVENPGFIVSCSAQPNGSSAASDVAFGGTVEMYAGVSQTITLSSIPGRADVANADASVTVKGLPSGLKLSGGTITGVPTKAGTYAVNVSFKNKLSWTSSFMLNIIVHSLPEWAQGTFTGMDVDYAVQEYGQATLTVSSAGKVSGKVSLCGTNWTFSAASYDSAILYESDAPAEFRIKADMKAGKAVLPVELSVFAINPPETDENPLQNARVYGRVLYDANYAELILWRTIWKDKATAAESKKILGGYEGVYTMSLDANDVGSGYLSLTVGKDGTVKASGKLADGTSVSVTSPLMYDDVAGGYFAYLYAAPSAYKGGSFALTVNFANPRGQLGNNLNIARWASRNPEATGEYGMGFARGLNFTGAYYDKLARLNDYYAMLSFEAMAPTLNGNQPTNADAVVMAFDGKGKPVIPKNSGLSLSFTQATGIFKGDYTFIFDTKTKKKVGIEGIMVQGEESLRGFYLWDAASEYEDAKTGKIKAYKYKESYPVTLQAQ